MTSYKVVVLEGAQKELRRLYSGYLLAEFGKAVAQKEYTAIKKSVNLLKTNPEMGTQIPGLSDLGFNHYRQMTVQRLNKIVYQIDRSHKTVYVHIFCSARQEFQTILNQRLLMD
ncbi:MAG TPA: type II toxin-antitoxin system RelE/ParE family toxin [Paralcaligenes sp.]|jgi:Plasmid stabilisation system protein.